MSALDFLQVRRYFPKCFTIYSRHENREACVRYNLSADFDLWKETREFKDSFCFYDGVICVCSLFLSWGTLIKSNTSTRAELCLYTVKAQGQIWEVRWNQTCCCLFPNFKTQKKGLWQKHHIMSSVTVLFWMSPKWDSLYYYILVLQENLIEDKLSCAIYCTLNKAA